MTSTEGIRIEPGSIHIDDDAWEWVETTADFIRWRAPLERHANGDVIYVYKTEPRGIDTLIEWNKHQLDESHGKRFGENGRIVASIPLNVLFDPKNQIAEKIREGDRDHMKWFINSEAARPWRNFRGKV